MDLPRGECIISEKIANFEAVYKKLPEDFRGVIRIFMKFEGRLHRGDILIDDGNILGVSLDDLDNSTSSYGEEALEEIKNKAPRSIGDVDVYKFGEIEMSLAIDSNERILFRHVIPLDREANGRGREAWGGGREANGRGREAWGGGREAWGGGREANGRGREAWGGGIDREMDGGNRKTRRGMGKIGG
ncbi:MAG: hypothetical protein B6U86_02070 [Candidatus Altiarchaeales archaeon ex4484_43]|nr:MAG: hypothetical protein B6U86_02070 [Candidatus Altiarchaeales archaeon ex4484_43]